MVWYKKENQDLQNSSITLSGQEKKKEEFCSAQLTLHSLKIFQNTAQIKGKHFGIQGCEFTFSVVKWVVVVTLC